MVCTIHITMIQFYLSCVLARDMMYISFTMGDFPGALLFNMDHVTLIAAGNGKLVSSMTIHIDRYVQV